MKIEKSVIDMAFTTQPNEIPQETYLTNTQKNTDVLIGLGIAIGICYLPTLIYRSLKLKEIIRD